MLKGFKDFILRGNVVDMAVGVVIGAAFGSIVAALVADLITPLIGAIAKVPDFSSLFFTFNESKFAVGDFINHLVSFVLLAAAVYFFVVTPINMLMARAKKAPEKAAARRGCPECLSAIPLAAKRCAFCTASVTPLAVAAPGAIELYNGGDGPKEGGLNLEDGTKEAMQKLNEGGEGKERE